MKKIVKNNQGFTLLELMVAVSIIGVLAGLAISNFSLYQSKARQSEAKIALVGIFALEKSFFAEHAAYIEDFEALGYEPEGLKRHYSVGWSNLTDANVVTSYSGGIGTAHFDYTNLPATWGTVCSLAVAQAGLNAAVAVAGSDPSTYEVKARGVLRQGLDCDEWSMTDEKVLSNTVINL